MKTVLKKAKKTYTSPPRPKSAEDPRCEIKKQCGSCLFVNEPYTKSLIKKHDWGTVALKKAKLLENVKIIAPEKAPRTFYYRNSAKLAVGKDFSLGLYEQGTHKVVEILDCPLHAPTINPFLKTLQAELRLSSLTPYREKDHQGDLRYITVRTSHHTGEIMVVFVVTSESPLIKDSLKELIKACKAKGHPIASGYLNLQPLPGNVIYGEVFHKLTLSENLRESLVDLDFSLAPSSFFQINPWQAEEVYRRIAHHAGTVDQGRTAIAWDLYCGLGPIAMMLARQGYRVWALEENPKAIHMAQHQLEKNHISQEDLEFSCGFAEICVSDAHIPLWAAHPQLVVANPSRKGLSESVRQMIKSLAQEKKQGGRFQFLYLSCSLESFQKDTSLLTEGNVLKLRQLEAFDMFPQTDKLEWLGIFTV